MDIMRNQLALALIFPISSLLGIGLILVATTTIPVKAQSEIPKDRPRVVLVKPVILSNDDGSAPAAYALPQTLVDRVYTKGGLEFLYLEPTLWNFGKARRGEINLDRIVEEGRKQDVICSDERVVTLLFVSAVDGQQGPLGRGMQNGNICFVTLGAEGKETNSDLQAFVVAHEIGHCLNLRHAVDDPAVPNDKANLQGEGPFAERLAVSGLHASQRETVLRSPLVLDRLRFHSIEEGSQLISDESWEPYISGASDDMLRFSIGMKAHESLPKPSRARTDFAKQKYSNKILKFSSDEEDLLTGLVAQLNELTSAQWPSVSRLPWQFIKVDPSFCAGMAHTRGLAIILSQFHLKRFQEDNMYGLKLLLHEKLHVIQRLNPTSFAKLYINYGFERITLAKGELNRFNLAQNPDGLQLNWAPRFGASPSIDLTLLTPSDKGDFTFKNELRHLSKRSDGTYTIGAIQKKGEQVQDWMDGFPIRTGHDHPNEISAYLASTLLEQGSLNTDLASFNAAQRTRLEETRQDFKRILRIVRD